MSTPPKRHKLNVFAMSASPPSPFGRSPPSLLHGNETETDKQATKQESSSELNLTMEEGVDIHAYDDSLHHYNAYAFDANAVVVDTGNPLEDVVVGTKRPLETTELIHDTITAPKRYKINNEERSQRTTTAAVATNKQWDAMFERLVAFKQRNGHCLVPKRYAEDPRLGTWVETQRVQYKRLQREYDEASGMEAVQPNKRLNQERLRKLQEIGFAWSAKHVRKQRNNSLPLEGLPPLPPTATTFAALPTPPDVNTATAGAMTTVMTMMMMPNHLAMAPSPHPPPPPAVQAVDGTATTTAAPTTTTTTVVAPPHPLPTRQAAVGRSKSESSRQGAGRLNDQQWEEMYQRLVRYKQEHGDCLVPRKYERDAKLSTWVETQRFLWNRDYRTTAADNTTAAMTANASTMGETTDQDRNYSSSTMMTSSLESMPPFPEPTPHIPNAVTDWSSGTDLADGEDDAVVAAAAAAAAEAVDEEVGGDPLMNMPSPIMVMASAATTKDSPTQPKRLTKERKEKLDAIGFVWSLRNKRIDDHWDEMFRQLVQYKEVHGDCLVPSRYEANLKLGKWVETQRYEYTKLKRAEATPSPKPEDTATMEDSKPGAKPRVTNARLTEERLRRLESIGFEWKVRNKMKRYYDKQWQEMFDQLLEFKSNNGHTMVPKRYPDNPRLANWVHTQRIQYRKLMSGGRKENQAEVEGSKIPPTEYAAPSGELKLSKEDEISFRLTDERRRKLEEIGFVWSVRESDAKTDQARMTRNSYDDLWDAMYERLKVFKEKYGNCLVPKRSKEDPKLGTWVDTQRVQYKKMKKKLADQGIPFDEQKPSPEEIQEAKAQNKPIVGRLTEDRIRRLNELGFVWSLRDDWTKHYEELKEFKTEHGHCNVPARYAKNRRLGIWVSAQRQQYKQMQSAPQEETVNRATPLTKDRIDLLNEIGFTWTIRSRDSLGESWNQRLQELREYREVQGNCLVPSRYPPNPELGIWVGTQRTQYRLYIKARESGQRIPGSSGMNEERIRQLEELGFVWALRGQEGGRRDDIIMKDTEISQDNAAVVVPENRSVIPNESVMVSRIIDALPDGRVAVQESALTHSHPVHHSEHHDHHNYHQNHQNDPEAILEEPSVIAAYHSVQDVQQV